MIIEDLKIDLSEAAQEKLKGMIAAAVESRIQKEAKKIAKKLAVKFIITGVALAGAYLLIDKSDKIVNLVTRSKD